MRRSTPLLACIALAGFAANSLLCRRALSASGIDAASFTVLRLLAGAFTLFALARAARSRPRSGGWIAGLALFAYAAGFSYAYLKLGAGLGALILFGSVQATMIGWSLARGHRPTAMEWAGLAVALAGLVALTLPGLTAPNPWGAALMAAAGIAWGVYSLLGKGSTDPLGATADNFARALPFAAVLTIVAASGFRLTTEGALLAILSGSVTSGICYSFWYAALKGLTASRAAIIQLSVPVLAGIGAVVFLGESLSVRLIVSGALILGGVGVAVAGRR